jgi:hypothetical protein
VSDGEQPAAKQPDEPMRRPRGRHAVPKARALAADGWRARLATVEAAVERRTSAAGAWLFERRLHALIVVATVTTVAMIGGAVALISFPGPQQPDDDAATIVVDTDRPTATDPGAPSTYAPILPSPGPPPSISPTNTPQPLEDEPVDPVTGAPVEPPSEPEATQPSGPETVPGATNRPDKPVETDKPEDPDTSEDCDDQGLLDVLFGPRCR